MSNLMRRTRSSGRRAGSWRAAPSALLVGGLLRDGLLAAEAQEPLGATPVDLAQHGRAGNAGNEPLEEQPAGGGIEVRESVHRRSRPFEVTWVSGFDSRRTEPRRGASSIV